MAHSNGLDDARDIATSNLAAAAPDLARVLLDARAELAATQTQVGDWIVRADEANVKVETLDAELARVRADAQAAVALMVERFRHDLQFMVDSIAEDKAYVADKYPALFKTIQARLAEMGTFGGVQVFGEIARDLLVLADADGLAAVEALRAEARENAMQALASMGQAQEAYEAQLEAETELAAAQQREAGLLAALEDPLVVHLNMVAGKIAKPLPSQLAHIYGEDVIRAALAPTPPADTWHERRTMLPDGDARKGEG